MPESSPSSGDGPNHKTHVSTMDAHQLMTPNEFPLFQKTTTITFADSDQSIEVDKTFLCQTSQFFAMAYSNPMKEFHENKIELQEVHPDTVRKFLDCFNNKGALLHVKLDADNFIDWVELAKFADFLNAYELCNNITSIAHEWFKTNYELPYEMDDIKGMVKYLPYHSGLRKLIVAAVAGTIDPQHCGKCEFNIHQTYPTDLAEAILRAHKFPITSYPQCDFHKHRSWEECEMCEEYRDGQFMAPFSAGPSEGW